MRPLGRGRPVTEIGFPWLVTLLALPAAVALIGSLRIDAELYRRLTLASSSLLFLLGAGLSWTAAPAAGMDLVDPWDPFVLLAGRPLLRLDALSALLVPFAALLWILAIGVTPRMALDRHGIRRTALATLTTLAVFLTESAPLLVTLWALSAAILLRGLATGGHRRALRVAAVYLSASTLLFAAGVVALRAGGAEGGSSRTASLCILAAVMIRKGIFPLHSWLPETFEHGRIGPIVLFSAPQIGAYVAIVLLVPRAPAGLLSATGLLALGTALYGAIAAVAQRNARRAFGYLFISQSALVLAGLECVSVEGLTGGLSLWLSSGVAFAALARCLAVLEARRGRLSLDRYNGGYERMPLLASSFLITALAAVGFPGTLGFIGHDLLVSGTVAQFPRTGFLVVAATCIGAIALIRVYFALFCGRLDSGVQLRLRTREVVLFAGFSGLLLVTGLAPGPILDRCEAVAAKALSQRAGIGRSRLLLKDDAGSADPASARKRRAAATSASGSRCSIPPPTA